jgi:Tfp pilus assembly protein PilE
MSKNSKKKIAFTLTELLVIIVVVAVLAAVTLPKMNKVLEGRKIMEAEQVMAAVRNEQEYRCALDKPYTTQFTQLSQSISTSETPNFNYELSALGMMARRKGATYQLEMPSYADGRLCCDGPGCASLNKDYPSCLDLKRKPDYQPGQTACQGPDPDPEPVGCTTPQPPDDTKECHSPSKPNSCGLVSRSYHCVGTNWVPESYPACENNKPDDEVRPCECGSEVATHTCDEDQHKWVIGNWSGCEVPAIEEEPCGAGFTGTKTRTKVCNTSTGTYDSWGDWDTSACVEGGVCRAFMDKYGYNWDHKCNQINKIKDLTYGGDDINNTNFINKCCKEPTTCSEWVELYASVASTWRSECNANMKIEDNSYHAADVTNENFPEKCCKAFP